MLEKSRKNTLAALNSSASAVPRTAMMREPEQPGREARRRRAATRRPGQATVRITSCGIVWKAETSIEATGNISRGIAIFLTIALLRTIDRVPAVNVSVK